ncbi:MAG TPA: phospholipase D-like domain-containing protein [Anaeromyxobacter sp.]|nr:phospholipase D-like domain-containing protein [Anaeromyxobacter sp.]
MRATRPPKEPVRIQSLSPIAARSAPPFFWEAATTPAFPAGVPLAPGGAPAAIELVPRQCTLQPYAKRAIPAFTVTGRAVAYASPDSTYAVTRRLIERAKRSILVGIYDFTASYVKEHLLEAMERGVRVSLMLDIDGQGERALFDDLARHGAECVPAPSCASDFVHQFASSHEKVIVIDDAWTLVQSGNYSNNSIPRNEGDGVVDGAFRFGNRDMGIAVESKELAKFFTEVLRADMKVELLGEGVEGVAERAAQPETGLLQSAPRKRPKLVPSLALDLSRAKIQPVLTPDNYMDVVPDLLAGAKETILIEQQYIKPSQPLVKRLLEAIRDNPNRPRVRVVLARPLSRGAALSRDLAAIRDLGTFGLALGEQVRLLDPSQYVHCHNKLVVVDGERVLVGSQNWSDYAVSRNREASLLVESRKLADYYAKLFASDWKGGVRELDARALQPEVFAIESLGTGNELVRIDAGDYVEV